MSSHNAHFRWDVSAAPRATALQLLLAEHGGIRKPISISHAFSAASKFRSAGFFSIAKTKFEKSTRLNQIRHQARRCFFAIFFLCALKRLTRCEGVLSIRVADRNFVDDTAAIQLPHGSRCQFLPAPLRQRFEELAINRLQVIFQPILLRRILRKSVTALFNAQYRDSVPPPTVEDLRLASPFFTLFPTSALERLLTKGTRRLYLRGMWVGAPRSERSAARSAVNRGSGESKLAHLLPQLAFSGVLPSITPALYSAFIVLQGSVVDLTVPSPSSSKPSSGAPPVHHNSECSIGECIGETCAFAEGGVDGKGFKVQSPSALTWEIDVFSIAEVISSLRPITSLLSFSNSMSMTAAATTSTSAASVSAAVVVGSPSGLMMAGSVQRERAAQKEPFDAIMQYIVEKRIRIMQEHFRPTISQVQNWSMFRGCATAVDVTTHVLPRLVPKVFFASTCIVGPDSGEADRGAYFIARGVVTSSQQQQGAAAAEWKSFGEYESYFSEPFDLSFHARTVVDCWVLPRQVVQSMTKNPTLRPGMISLGLQMREALLRRCGPVRDVIEHLLVQQFLGGQRYLCDQIIDTVLKLLQPRVWPAGERCITAGEDEKTCLFFVRGKLQQSSANGFIAHNPPHLYAPAALSSMLDPQLCRSVGPILSSWKLSLVAVRNVECWTVSAAALHAALKSFFENCDLPHSALVSKTPFPGSASALIMQQQQQHDHHHHPSSKSFRSAVSSHKLLRNRSADTLQEAASVSFSDTVGSKTLVCSSPSAAFNASTSTLPPGVLTAKDHRRGGSVTAPVPPATAAATQQQRPQQRGGSGRGVVSATAVPASQNQRHSTSSAAIATATATASHPPHPPPPGYVRASDGRLWRGPPRLRTSTRGTERVVEMRKQCAHELEEAMQGPTINRSWTVDDMPVPPRSTARRMKDLECIGNVPLEPPADKRMFLLLRRLPQTPRVHGKLPAEFTSTRFLRQHNKCSLGTEGQQQKLTEQQLQVLQSKVERGGSARRGGKGSERGGRWPGTASSNNTTSAAAGGGLREDGRTGGGNDGEQTHYFKPSDLLLGNAPSGSTTFASGQFGEDPSFNMGASVPNVLFGGGSKNKPPPDPDSSRTLATLDRILDRQKEISVRSNDAEKEQIAQLRAAATVQRGAKTKRGPMSLAEEEQARWDEQKCAEDPAVDDASAVVPSQAHAQNAEQVIAAAAASIGM